MSNPAEFILVLRTDSLLSNSLLLQILNSFFREKLNNVEVEVGLFALVRIEGYMDDDGLFLSSMLVLISHKIALLSSLGRDDKAL